MSRRYKRMWGRPLAAGLVVLTVLLAAVPAVRAQAAAQSSAAFCKNIDVTAAALNKAITAKTDAQDKARATRAKNLAANRSDVDDSYDRNRVKWDKQLETNAEKLAAKAETDSQKAAVQEYVSSVKDAVGTRRAAFDDARSVFHRGVDGVIAAHKATVDADTRELKTQVAAAVAAAKSACANNAGDSGGTIKTTFITSLTKAKASFNAKRKSDSDQGKEIKELADARTASFKSAITDFQASMKTARETLLAAFEGTKIKV